MKRNLFNIIIMIAVSVLLQPFAFGGDVSGVWETTYNTMTLTQSGQSVNGEYIYDNGVVTGTLDGQNLTGWWREYGNTKECGPGNAWSGPVVLKFSQDFTTFTGSWGYCGTEHADLNPDGSGWTGTRRAEGTLTESECSSVGRYWCNGVCQVTACGTSLDQESCEQLNRYWCDGFCQLAECGGSVIETDCVSQGLYYCNGACSASECPAVDSGDKFQVGTVKDGKLMGMMQYKANFPEYINPVDIWVIVFGPGKSAVTFGSTNLVTKNGLVTDDGFSYPKFAENETGPITMTIGESFDPCSSEYAGVDGDMTRWGVYYLVAPHESISNLPSNVDQLLSALSNNPIEYFWFDADCGK